MNTHHPRDQLLSFSEADHVYIHLPTGEQYTSGTTFLHKFFAPFDGPMVVDKMMNGRNWSKSPYHGMTKEAILGKWEADRDDAAKRGTLMHSRIEQEILGKEVDWSEQQAERDNFRIAYGDLEKEGWKVYRLEWRIFTEKNRVAGTLDGLFVNGEGKFLLLDWKRSKEIKKENQWQRALKPLSHLPDCNYVQYCLQLNLYRWILLKHYNITVSEMRLYSFHPNQPIYMRYNIPVMEKEMALIM